MAGTAAQCSRGCVTTEPVRTSVVHEQDVDAVGIGPGELVEDDLHGCGVQLRQDEPEGVTAVRVDAPVQPTAPALVLGHSNRLHAPSGDPPATNRSQVPAARVVSKQAYRFGIALRENRFQPLGGLGFERSDGIAA